MSEQLSQFNDLHKQLCDDIVTTFNLQPCLDTPPLKHFLKNVLPFMDDVSCKNVDAFKYKHKMFIVQGIAFVRLLDNYSTSNVGALWKYLQTLYILAYNTPELPEYLKELEDYEHYDLINKNLEGKNYAAIIQNFISCDANMPSVSKKVKKPAMPPPTPTPSPKARANKPSDANLPSFLEDSLIGTLAKEISEEIDPVDLGNIESPADLMQGLLGGGNAKLGDLINTVVQKLDAKMKSGSIDQAQLISEANGMMGKLNLFGNATQPEPPNSAASSVDTTNVSTEATAKKKSSRRKKKGKRRKN